MISRIIRVFQINEVLFGTKQKIQHPKMPIIRYPYCIFSHFLVWRFFMISRIIRVFQINEVLFGTKPHFFLILLSPTQKPRFTMLILTVIN